jgi:hypothetical protein
MPKVFNRTKINAVSTIEIVLTIALFSLMVLAVSTTVTYVIKTSSQSTASIKAALLASQGLEAMRDIKDENFATLVDGSYGLSSVSGKWALSGTNDVTEVFTRQVTVAADAANTTLPDIISKKITVTVTWGSPTKTYSVSTLMTNWGRSRQTYGNWALPVLVNTLDLSGTADLIKIKKVGNYLFGIRSATTNNFVVINVANPLVPTYVTQLTVTSGTPADIDISGNYAYVASSNTAGEIAIVNITNPLIPTLAVTYNATGNVAATSVHVIGNRLYYTRTGSSTTAEFNILNITNPIAPTVVGVYEMASNNTAYDAYIMGNYAYLVTAHNSQELTVVNITNESVPTSAGLLNLATNNDAVSITGFANTLLVGDVLGVVSVINVTTPTAPTLRSTYNAGGRIYGILTNSDNSVAFLATSSTINEFRTLNISNLATPILLGVYNLSGTTIIGGIYYDPVLDMIFMGTNNDAQELVILKST